MKDQFPPDLPAFKVEAARRRLRYLLRWREAVEAAGGRDRARLAGVVAGEIKREEPGAQVSPTRLYCWDLSYRRHGLRGLVDFCGRHGDREGRVPEKPLSAIALPQLLQHAQHVLGELHRRLNRFEAAASQPAAVDKPHQNGGEN